MKTIKGDLIKLVKEGKFDVIVHGCNCQNIMGGGIAKQIKNEFPEVYELDQKTKRGDKSKLGTIDFHHYPSFYVVNAYTQFGIGGERACSYDALEQCFQKIRLRFKIFRVGIPLIGCGLGGADFRIVRKIIEVTCPGMNITVVEYQK